MDLKLEDDVTTFQYLLRYSSARRFFVNYRYKVGGVL